MPKKITIEQLAEMLQKGFEATASKDDIRQLERRIDGVELKISAYASRWNEGFDRLHR